MENLKSAIGHDVDKYDLFPGIKAQTRAFRDVGITLSSSALKGWRHGPLRDLRGVIAAPLAS
ncbi:hypothetical protein [Thauera sp. WH-1]|uniref:hypothetical protein n=1 Tax=Thauera sp. WH-1 TaxID=3398230 RepID=UPI0039FC83F4